MALDKIRKYLGNVRCLPKFIPAQSQITHLMTCTVRGHKVSVLFNQAYLKEIDEVFFESRSGFISDISFDFILFSIKSVVCLLFADVLKNTCFHFVQYCKTNKQNNIYIVIHRQTVSFYLNSSDTQTLEAGTKTRPTLR